ncbi:MAG: SRPBCC domain-containing protein [Euryarchaeota archaeon]|nr:SRPBCC domain-containing protein [Euryarchaeota archaeon]
MANDTISKSAEIVVTRTFDAPRERVWKAWTDVDQMKSWWGPKGFTVPKAHLDIREGGKFHYCMRAPDGKEYWGTGIYEEVSPPERLVMTDSFSDPDGNVVHASTYGIEGDYPLEMQVTVTFEDVDGKTRLTLRHSGLPAGGGQGESSGWNEMFDRLTTHLEGSA